MLLMLIHFFMPLIRLLSWVALFLLVFLRAWTSFILLLFFILLWPISFFLLFVLLQSFSQHLQAFTKNKWRPTFKFTICSLNEAPLINEMKSINIVLESNCETKSSMVFVFWYFCNMFNWAYIFVKQFLDLFHDFTRISLMWDFHILVDEMIFYIWLSFHVWCFALTFPLIFLVFVALSSRNVTIRATFSISFIVFRTRTRMTTIMSAISRHIHDSYYLNIFLSQIYRKISKKRYIKISYTDVLIKGLFFCSAILYLSVQ